MKPLTVHEKVLKSLFSELCPDEAGQEHTHERMVTGVLKLAKTATVARHADVLSTMSAADSMGIPIEVQTGSRHWHGGPAVPGPRLKSTTALYRAGVFIREHGCTSTLKEADWLRFAAAEKKTTPSGIKQCRAYLTDAFHAIRGFSA